MLMITTVFFYFFFRIKLCNKAVVVLCLQVVIGQEGLRGF